MNDPRKAVFDAIRSTKGRILASEVAIIDTALDAIGFPRGGYRLGALSEEFESAGRGPGAVSSGKADPGGVSYGIWQLSSRAGTAAEFVAAEGARWGGEFAGAKPGSEAFSAAWKRIAAHEPEAFAAAQHAFIKRTHYDPAVKAVRDATGLDLDSRHAAVRDVAWSVAVQHGRAATILCDAIRVVQRHFAPSEPEFDRALVNAIYQVRTDYVLAIGERTGGVTRQTMQTIASKRYPAERAKALEMLA